MTLPNERYRAVKWAERFLVRLLSPYGEGGIKRIPREIRREAAWILKHFPSGWEMERVAKKLPDLFETEAQFADRFGKRGNGHKVRTKTVKVAAKPKR